MQESRHEKCVTHVASCCCTSMQDGLDSTSAGSLAVLFEGTRTPVDTDIQVIHMCE
jgi:hypothetical protein